MGAFIGYENVGIWVTNRERDAFLDWYAEHRCQVGDPDWVFCKDEANRWPGCCIELSELIPQGRSLNLTEEERQAATIEHSPMMAELLSVIEQIVNGQWSHSISSSEAVNWRSDNFYK